MTETNTEVTRGHSVCPEHHLTLPYPTHTPTLAHLHPTPSLLSFLTLPYLTLLSISHYSLPTPTPTLTLLSPTPFPFFPIYSHIHSHADTIYTSFYPFSHFIHHCPSSTPTPTLTLLFPTLSHTLYFPFPLEVYMGQFVYMYMSEW